MNLFRKVDHVIMKNIQRKVALEYFREDIDQAGLAKKYGRAQKVSNSNGKYTESDIIAAIQYLKKHHAF